MNPKGNVATANAIKDINKLNDMKDWLLKHNERDYLLFVLGINSGLRITDLLKLTVEDVKDGSVIIREQKTHKTKQFALSDTCIRAINQYLENTGIKTGTLFPSASCRTRGKPITREYAWSIFKKAANYVGITENIGTHSMRKSFAYWALRNGVDIAFIMEALNHSDLVHTKRYIGITADELNNVLYKNMNL
ncbi:MAG: xerC 5 [Massilibacillus sp.]|nr:xerC 5 [Massilibacillus sp.]